MPPRIPPLLLVAVLAAVMWAIDRALPPLDFAPPWRVLTSGASAVAGLLLCLAGVRPFRRAGTTVDPRFPERSSTLVTTGVYAVTRNPMYVGFLLVLAGWGLWLSNAAALVLGPAALALYLDRVQIPAEERALAASFGDAYARYARRVRRWL